MRIYLSVIFIIFWPFAVFSQGSYFSKLYDFFGAFDASTQIVNLDSGYLCAGVVQSSPTDVFQIGIMKIDENGDEIFKKTYSLENVYLYAGIGGSFKKNLVGGYVLASSIRRLNGNEQGMLMCFNENGDSLWTRFYGQEDSLANTMFFNCVNSTNGGYALIGFTDSVDDPKTNILMLKVDSAGNELWRKTFGASNRTDRGFSIDNTQDGGFVFGGYSINSDWSYSYACIYKTDSLGNLEWVKTFPGIFQMGALVSETKDENGFIMVSGTEDSTLVNTYNSIWVAKLNLSGDTIWTRKIGSSLPYHAHEVFIELNDGSIVVAGQTSVTSDSSGEMRVLGLLFKVGPNGDSLWYHTYDYYTGENSDNYFRDFKPTPDGGFICAGFTTPHFPDSVGQDMWVIKLDSNGCEAPGPCENPTTAEFSPPAKEELVVFPNPFSLYLNLKIPDEFEGQDAFIQIFDLLGRVVYSNKLFVVANPINLVPELIPGIYFLKFEIPSKGYQRINKIIKAS